MTPKKSLTLADSKPAHLDVIRRLEFVENQRKELLALTFSEDATIRTWRVTYSTSDSQAGEAVNVSKIRLTVPDLPGPLPFKPGLATHETKEWRPPNFQEQPSRKQLGRAAYFLNLEASKNPIAKLKRGVIVRAHPRAIFSSCVGRFQNAPVRVFSGDQSGTINCYEVESDGLGSGSRVSKPVRSQFGLWTRWTPIRWSRRPPTNSKCSAFPGAQTTAGNCCWRTRIGGCSAT